MFKKLWKTKGRFVLFLVVYLVFEWAFYEDTKYRISFPEFLFLVVAGALLSYVATYVLADAYDNIKKEIKKVF